MAAVVAMLWSPSSTRADTNPVLPDVHDWKVTSKSTIDVVVSGTVITYLGNDIEYQNPNDASESVRVISRYVPLTIAKQIAKNDHEFQQVALATYAKRDQETLLTQLASRSDPIIYFKWRVFKDPRTGKDIRDGDVSVWLLNSNGAWVFATNQKVLVQFLSERVKDGVTRNILVGRKYQLGKDYQILEPDRRYLEALEEKR